MNIENLIHEYVDGSLGIASEEKLFLQLASNDELRAELKQQLAMKNAIRSDSKAFTPKAESTINIFSSLGFSAPIPAKQAVEEPRTGFYARNGKAIYSSLVSIILTIVIVYLLFDWPGMNSNNNSAGEHANTAKILNDIPVISSKRVDNDYNRGIYKPDTVYTTVTKIKYVKVPAENAPSEIIDTKTPEKEVKVARVNIRGQELEYFSAKDDLFQFSQMPVERVTFLPHDESGILSKFSFEYRRNEDYHTIETDIGPKYSQRLNNTSFALLYQANDIIKIGFDYRRENFIQKFEHTDADGVLWILKQQPNIENIGPCARFDNFVNSYGFSPFGQIGYSFSKAGPILRIMAGISYSPMNNINFILGYEYSRMSFMVDGKNYLSTKGGINYGINFNL